MLYHDFIVGLLVGGVFCLSAAFIAAWAVTRIARLPSPTGYIFQQPLSAPLPVEYTNDAKERHIEQELLNPYNDAPPGLGR